MSVDRYGTFHPGVGLALGKALTKVSWSITGNWLNQSSKPTQAELNNFLNGNGFNIGGGAILGGGVSYTPQEGQVNAYGVGLYSIQGGGSWTYSPEFLNYKTHLSW